jgi:hypothetical protein
MSETRAVELWSLEPLRRFVAEAGARLALLTTPSGQVVAQHGFTRAVDLMSAAALGSAIAASTAQLCSMLNEPEFRFLNHQGAAHGVFIGRCDTPRGPLLLLAVYDSDSSPGLVQLFFEELSRALVASCPPMPTETKVLAEDFERELMASLNTLFGR